MALMLVGDTRITRGVGSGGGHYSVNTSGPLSPNIFPVNISHLSDPRKRQIHAFSCSLASSFRSPDTRVERSFPTASSPTFAVIDVLPEISTNTPNVLVFPQSRSYHCR